MNFDFEIRCARRKLMVAALGLTVCASGCSYFAEQPEVYPEKFAPAESDRAWTPKSNEYVIPMQARPASTLPEPHATSAGHQYDLPALIDIALSNNPDTRLTWDQARAAAAAYGVSRAPYYPVVATQVPGGYERQLFELPGKNAVLKQWQVTPVIDFTYILLDFGRRDAGAAAARAQLAAANFSFNRKLQDVVFATQRSFYSIGAAKAAVKAAEQNVELARTDDDAVSRRVDLGLATEPELLLSRQRVAQSQYDLASAHLLVREAQANMAVALGVAANTPLDVPNLDSLPIPAGLGSEVDQLIETAVRSRPDLAAQVATLDARRADVARTKSAFYPTVGISGSYGEQSWDYKYDGTTSVNGQPAAVRRSADDQLGHLHRIQASQRRPPGRGESRRGRRAAQVARGRCDQLRVARVLRVPDRAQPLRVCEGPAGGVAGVIRRQPGHVPAGAEHDRRAADCGSRSRERALHDCPEPRGLADVIGRRRVRRGSHRDAASVT